MNTPIFFDEVLPLLFWPLCIFFSRSRLDGVPRMFLEHIVGMVLLHLFLALLSILFFADTALLVLLKCSKMQIQVPLAAS